jgi:broad specificity polyphosphatase/5'/3'-nucleotidase SurE
MILITNDDGVYSPGIQILAKRLKVPLRPLYGG